MHNRQRRNAFVAAVRESFRARGLPDEIVSVILGTAVHAVNVIVRAARAMNSDHRAIRLSIRWFRLNAGLPEPVFVCNHSWFWVDRVDLHIAYADEFCIHETWVACGRPNPLRSPLIWSDRSAPALCSSYKSRIHYTELHALRRTTGRARRSLPHRWVASINPTVIG